MFNTKQGVLVETVENMLPVTTTEETNSNIAADYAAEFQIEQNESL